MKASELRIGNYVMLDDGRNDGEIIMITGTNAINGGHVYDEDGDIYGCNMIQPIPLTEQWLVDFGSREYLGSKRSFKYSRFDLFWREDYKYWYVTDFEDETYMTKIEFVHEFQNFIFAMDQEELTIKEKV